MKRRALMLCAMLLGAHGLATAAEWPQWRGPDGQGHVPGTSYPLQWSEAKNVAWKTKLPGRGHSSPVIDGNHIWLTAADEAPISEERRKEKLAKNTGSQPLTLVGELTMLAICVDCETGKVVKTIKLITDPDPDWTHQINTFASPSPVLDDGRLYCAFGTHGNACVDTKSGDVKWTDRGLKLNHENGAGSTPIVWGDHFIVHCDGSDVQYIAALDKRTGKLAWKTPRSGELRSDPQLRKSYGTPLVVKLQGRDQLISPGADWLYSYDPTTGEELWKLSYEELGFSVVPRPVFGHGMLYFSTSFMRGQILAVKFDPSGKPEIAWRYSKQAPKIPSPILVGDELYFISDAGVATCLDARTGALHWEERLAGNFAASPTLADGRLYFSNREGKTYVVQPGTTYKLLATNTLDGGHWASFAGVDGAFYVRTDKALYRIEPTRKGN
jgi:outer membrane protein assembly factor BamB